MGTVITSQVLQLNRVGSALPAGLTGQRSRELSPKCLASGERRCSAQDPLNWPRAAPSWRSQFNRESW